MNISNLAKQWLIEHNHYEHDSSFQEALKSLVKLIETVAFYDGHIGDEPDYDPKFGDNKLCECGHTYYRHFDPYQNMDAVGCKYCYLGDHYGNNSCAGFKEKESNS